MAASDVVQVDTDPNGRAVLMTVYMRDWWERVVGTLDFASAPVIVQGAWMARVGGGAAKSAGYHDAGGCLDLRTWNLSSTQQEKVIRVTRSLGAASWRRDARHGMDPHIHLVLGSDYGLASGARYQWQQYIDGRDGLARNGPDYEWRPSPLVLRPEEDDMPLNPTDLAAVRKQVDASLIAYFNNPGWNAYQDPANPRRLSHILLRVDLGVRRLLGQKMPTADEIAAAIVAKMPAGEAPDVEVVKQGVREVFAELADGDS